MGSMAVNELGPMLTATEVAEMAPPRGPPASRFYKASPPVSPVRMRIDSSIVETKILPSPI